MNCTAHVRDGRCEVWAPTQNPDGAAAALEKALGIPRAAITIHLLRAGGGFGRRYYSDFVVEAALLSRTAGRPVQVVWTREDDIRHGFYRPAGYHVLRGGVDASGRPVAWSHHLINATRGEYLRWEPSPGETRLPPGDGELRRDTFPGGFIPNYRLAHTPVASAIPRGQWRAVADSALGFVDQSFLDELAHLGGRDPLALRLDLLGPSRMVRYGMGQYSTGRLRAVLELAAAKAGWGATLPRGRGRGIAGGYANGAYCAHVAEVEVGADGAVRVRRVVSTIDCGTAVNPLGVEAQVEGSVAYGLSAALWEEITVEGGRVRQSNFHDYRTLHIDEMPRVEVHVVPSEEPPLGVGETALPPVAPAVANAVFAATGVRVRRLPMRRVAVATD
jgi:isoquinoline 1-oxidoreductase beta subunit